MSTRSVKQQIARSQAATSPAGSKVTADEAKQVVAEAKVGGVRPAERKAVQDLFDRGDLTPAAKAELSAVLEAAAPTSLASLVPASWRGPLAAELAGPGFKALEQFLEAEQKKGPVFPPRAKIFAALDATPPAKVKVVIIGQDPYPTAGNANGLAFSVAPGQKVPASLKNIYAGIKADTGAELPRTGDLTPWAKEGVLLLNTVLTVREGAPNSHRDHGWEPFTEGVLEKVNDQPGPVVFLCFGAQARKMAEQLVDTHKHTILAAPHPSPLNGHAFVDAAGRDHLFSRTNELLKNGGRGGIDWALH